MLWRLCDALIHHFFAPCLFCVWGRNNFPSRSTMLPLLWPWMWRNKKPCCRAENPTTGHHSFKSFGPVSNRSIANIRLTHTHTMTQESGPYCWKRKHCLVRSKDSWLLVQDLRREPSASHALQEPSCVWHLCMATSPALVHLFDLNSLLLFHTSRKSPSTHFPAACATGCPFGK